MTSYVHLKRYGKPRGDDVATVTIGGDAVVYYNGRPWNLRTGEKGPFHEGFDHGANGRYLRYAEDNTVELVHPDGRVARTEMQSSPNYVGYVGGFLIAMDGYSVPLTVFDADGKNLGKLVGMEDENPAIENPGDGKTLWLGEAMRLVQFDIATREIVRSVAAQAGTELGAFGVLPDGHIAACLQPTEATAAKRVVAYDPTGKLIGSYDLTGDAAIALNGLGTDRYVLTDYDNKRFLVLDRSLAVVGEVAMFDPGRQPLDQVVMPLPSGREWLSIGGRGEWEHYGEPGLGPSPDAAKKPAAKKPAAKKPAAKKPAKKPAAKKPAKKKVRKK